jgi:hypothetical protein
MTMAYDSRDYWVSGLRPPSGIPKNVTNTAFWKTDVS